MTEPRNDTGAPRIEDARQPDGSADYLNVITPAERGTGAPVTLTLYANARATRPVAADPYDSWDEYVAELDALTACEAPGDDKRALVAWSPHVLESGRDRDASAVVSVTALVIDVDVITDDQLVACLDRAEQSGWGVFVYASPGDPNPDGTRRVRIVSPVSRHMTPGECGRARIAFADSLGLVPGQGVEACLDASRMFFVGRLAGAPERGSWPVPGGPVDVDALLARQVSGAWPDPRAAASVTNDASCVAWATGTERVQDVVALLAPEWPPAGVQANRRELVRALGGYLARQGWSDQAVYDCVLGLPSDTPHERAALAVETARQARTGTTTAGYATLETRLGESVARAVDHASTSAQLNAWEVTRRARPRTVTSKRAAVSRSVTVAKDVGAPGAGTADEPSRDQPERDTDLGNARRLVRLHGDDFQYCPARRVWLVWDGRRWADDETGAIVRAAKQSAEGMWAEIPRAEDKKAAARWAAQSQNAGRIDATVKLAQTEEAITVRIAELDADPWALNVQNGIVDLRTGELAAHGREHLMTKIAGAQYYRGARSERWEAFLHQLTGGDSDLARYLQRALGYALLGEWREKAFWFGYGPPDGGKSTLLAIVRAVLGDYCVCADAETWMRRATTGGNRGDLVRLLGARLVFSSEIKEGMRVDERLVKAVTGGDPIVASAKYEGEIEFRPRFALWWLANDPPIIRDDDEGMWARARVVPFEHVVPKTEQDTKLSATLSGPEHAPAVLAWLVEGCLAWQAEGIGDCEAVRKASAKYRREMNRALGFVEEQLEITRDPRDEVSNQAMQNAYLSWCSANGVHKPLPPKVLGRRLRELGVAGGDDASKRRTKTGSSERFWKGVRLLGTVGLSRFK